MEKPTPPVRWIKAVEALELVKPSQRLLNRAQAVIVDYAVADLVRTRCRRLLQRSKSPKGPDQRDDVSLTRQFWIFISDADDWRQNWIAGTFSYIGMIGEVTAYDVEFVEEDILSIPGVKAPVADATRASPAPADGRKAGAVVSPAQLQAWFDNLTPEDRALGYRQLWPKAKAALGDGVRRKQVEPLCGGRNPGPRPAAK